MVYVLPGLIDEKNNPLQGGAYVPIHMYLMVAAQGRRCSAGQLLVKTFGWASKRM